MTNDDLLKWAERRFESSITPGWGSLDDAFRYGQILATCYHTQAIEKVHDTADNHSRPYMASPSDTLSITRDEARLLSKALLGVGIHFFLPEEQPTIENLANRLDETVKHSMRGPRAISMTGDSFGGK